MIPICRGIKAISIILFIAMATSFCASKNYLVVNYKLPEEAMIPGETSVSLTFKDSREDPAILTKSAKMALKNFSDGFFILYVAQENNDKQENKDVPLKGAFSLHSMITQIFKHRLENAGIRVAPQGESRETVVEIILKAFKLDLVGRKWVINMSYQANLVRQNQFTAGETVTGSAERLRVVGSKDAELVIGELITDVVNRLNLSELFKSNEIQ
jgi:hypothetical protein